MRRQFKLLANVGWLACAVLTLAAFVMCDTSDDAFGALLAITPVVASVSLADQVGSIRRDIGVKLDARGKLFDEAGQLEAELDTLRQKSDRTEDESKAN